MAEHKVERCGTNIARAVTLEGRTVGFAEQLANGQWGAYDEEDFRLSRLAFKTPAQVAKWFDRHFTKAEA